MKSHAINWFEIPVTDISRAQQFFEGVFGYELSLNEVGPVKMAWFPMTEDAPGASGSLVLADGYTPSHNGTLVYFSVDDIEKTLAIIEQKGGKTLAPKTSIGEHGFFARFEDTEGNQLAIHCMT